ncbi:MAG: nuclear transport factor 2 family protein [candidate division Zixibacteria bacterium]
METKDILLHTDREFAKLALENGARAAFDYYMADDARIYAAGIEPRVGRDSILSLFPKIDNDILNWEPYFADIAASGDLGYTLGKYKSTHIDDSGKASATYGNYVTIWKKQPDGQWKFVFDTGHKSSSE